MTHPAATSTRTTDAAAGLVFGVVTQLLLLLLSGAVVLLRQPCPENYVRLVDLPAMGATIACLVLAADVVCLLVLRTERLSGKHLPSRVLGVLSTLLALGLLGLDLFVGSDWLNGCWTF